MKSGCGTRYPEEPLAPSGKSWLAKLSCSSILFAKEKERKQNRVDSLQEGVGEQVITRIDTMALDLDLDLTFLLLTVNIGQFPGRKNDALELGNVCTARMGIGIYKRSVRTS